MALVFAAASPLALEGFRVVGAGWRGKLSRGESRRQINDWGGWAGIWTPACRDAADGPTAAGEQITVLRNCHALSRLSGYTTGGKSAAPAPKRALVLPGPSSLSSSKMCAFIRPANERAPLGHDLGLERLQAFVLAVVNVAQAVIRHAAREDQRNLAPVDV